jgi:hypothetical protein
MKAKEDKLHADWAKFDAEKEKWNLTKKTLRLKEKWKEDPPKEETGMGKETTGGVGGSAFIQRNKKILSKDKSVQ